MNTIPASQLPTRSAIPHCRSASGHRWRCFLLCVLGFFGLQNSVRAQRDANGIRMLLSSYTSTSPLDPGLILTSHYSDVDGPERVEWRMDRALSPEGPWFPYNSGMTLINPAAILLKRVTRREEPHPNLTVGMAGQAAPNYISVGVLMQVDVTSGACYARWHSPGGATPATWFAPAVNNTPPELELRHPTAPLTLPFGAVWITVDPPAGSTGPAYLITAMVSPDLFDVLPEPAPLTPDEQAVRDIILQLAPDIRDQLWNGPPVPYSPPLPPTFETRAFFRVHDTKTFTGSNDTNANYLPDNFEQHWYKPLPADRHLIISEAGYANGQHFETTDSVASGLITVPSSNDWVELMNPNATSITLSAANTFALTDTAANKTKWPLPSGTVPPGGTVLLNLASLQLPDKGTTLYLYRVQNGTASATPVDTFLPPPASAFPGRAPANYSYGRRILGGTATGTASFTTGFMLRPSPGALNTGYTVSGVTAEPSIVDGASTATPKPVLAGRLFRTGEVTAAITAPAGAIVTYTLDNTEPHQGSAIYEGPFVIRGTCTLRARAFAPDKLPSQVITRTFIHTPSVLTAHYLPAAGRTVAVGYGLAPTPAREPFDDPGESILDQLENVPSIFITWPEPATEIEPGTPDDLPGIGPDGVPHYRASFEYYDPACPADYRQENCHIQISPQDDNNTACLKSSWDVFFSSDATLSGTAGWTGPVTTSGGVTCSKVFPGSKVTSWPALLLRGMARDSFEACDTGNEYFLTYTSDPWVRSLQQLAATATLPAGSTPQVDVIPQRRFVHAWLNGRYHGIYDLNEPPTRETISAHLLSRLPASASQAERDALQPSQIEFLSPCAASQSPGAAALWLNEVQNPCNTAYGSPGFPQYYQDATAHLDMDSYVRYCSILEYSYISDSGCSWRAWRHPGDQKWRFFIWEADNTTFGRLPWVNRDRYISKNVSGVEIADQPKSLQPLFYLKGVDGFQNAFAGHLAATAPILFNFTDTEVRFVSLVTQAREFIEADAMRWGGMPALEQWSGVEPWGQSGTLTLATGVEYYRRLLSNENLIRYGTTHETNSLYNLLSTAAAFSLFTGDYSIYETPYSQP